MSAAAPLQPGCGWQHQGHGPGRGGPGLLLESVLVLGPGQGGQEFLQVFAAYNTSIWPLQLIATILALVLSLPIALYC